MLSKDTNSVNQILSDICHFRFRPQSNLYKLLAKLDYCESILIIDCVHILKEEKCGILKFSFTNYSIFGENLGEIWSYIGINQFSAVFSINTENDVSTFVDISCSSSNLVKFFFNLILILFINLLILTFLLDKGKLMLFIN